MKASTAFKKGDPGMKAVVSDCRVEMNNFVSYYRRNNKVAGAASFSTLYTAISTLSGHFQSYGDEYPVPEKRKKVPAPPRPTPPPHRPGLAAARSPARAYERAADSACGLCAQRLNQQYSEIEKQVSRGR